MPYNDKTMNPMKHNGKPQINDEDTPLKSTPLKQFLIQQPVQTGDSGTWKKDETSSNEIFSIFGRQKSIDNNGQEGQSYINGESDLTPNGNAQKDEAPSRHSKFFDPNGNSTQSSGFDSVESTSSDDSHPDQDQEADHDQIPIPESQMEIEKMEISSDDRIDEPVTEENIQAQSVGTENTPIVIKQPVNVRPDKVRQMADFEKSQMQALCNQRRAAQLIERILTIRTRLMDPFSFAGRNESKKAGVRIHRNGQHLDGITPSERVKLPPLPPPPTGSVCETSETTDESENEDFQPHIGSSEHKHIRLREKMEEEKSTTIESRRLWLLRRIKQCDQVKKELELPIETTTSETEESEQEQDSCARTRLFRHRKKRRPKLIRRTEEERENQTVQQEQHHNKIRLLDDSFHHVLSTPRSIPLSVRLTTILHEIDPTMRIDMLKKPSKKVDLLREKKRKKDKKRVGDSLNQIVVPSSSLITSIEMPKYKNIDVPGYRSDETSDSIKEDQDEDISHEAFVRRHIESEKKEKLRYYQSAIKNSRKRKKQQIDPRIASPTLESYVIKTSSEKDVLIGYKKLNYPISPSQIGDFGYKGDTVVPKKQKRQKKQEWQSSPCTEGTGGGLRLKLSLRKL